MPTALPATLQATTAVSTVSAATAVVFPAAVANQTLFLHVLASSGAAFTDTATLTGGGVTWTKVAGIVLGNDYSALFVGYGTTAGAGAATLTLSRTATSGQYTVIGVLESQDGTNNPIAASGSTSGTNTSGSLTLTRSGLGNLCMGFWGHKAAEGTTPDSTTNTWTELVDQTTVVGLEVQYLFNGFDQTHTASWLSNVNYFGFAVQFSRYNQYTSEKKTATTKPAYGYTSIDIDSSEEVATTNTGIWAIH